MNATKRALATVDGIVECGDTGCDCTAHDVIDEYRGIWLLECFLCGTKQRLPAIKGVSITKSQDKEFVFRDGRFSGMTISQVAAEDVGREYIEWAAKEHPRQFVKSACQKWLDALQASP